MIIRDLQHIETATETEVKGGFYWKNVAESTAGAQAFGEYTYTQSITDTLAIKDQFSGSYARSVSEAS
ncbi:MAG: hypothetical protein ACRC1Z_04115 [Waterburya sp.]